MIKIALRNLLRNGKRTFLTVSAVLIAILGSMMMQGWIRGSTAMMTEEGKKLSGDIRITHKDYEISSKSLDISKNIDYSQSKKIVEKYSSEIKNLGRITFGTIIFCDDKDIVAVGNGIEKEDYEKIGFDSYIYEGRFINFDNEGEIIVGDIIREKLNLKLGDSISLLSNTQYGSMSAFNYEVVGFYRMDNKGLNQSVYISLADAQYHLDMDGAVTEHLIFVDNPKDIEKIYEDLVPSDKYLILPWNKIGVNEYLSKTIPIFNGVFLLILGILAGVGIGNTMMMVVFERRKEIGVMKAQGMRNSRIRRLLCMEGLIMGLTGGIGADIIGGSLLYHYSKKGIDLGDIMDSISSNINMKSIIYMDFSWELLIFPLLFGLTIAFLATLAAIGPELKKQAVENLRDG